MRFASAKQPCRRALELSESLVLAAGVGPKLNVDTPAAGALGFAAPASAKAGALPDVLAEKDAPKLGTVHVAAGAAPPNPNPADDARRCIIALFGGALVVVGEKDAPAPPNATPPPPPAAAAVKLVPTLPLNPPKRVPPLPTGLPSCSGCCLLADPSVCCVPNPMFAKPCWEALEAPPKEKLAPDGVAGAVLPNPKPAEGLAPNPKLPPDDCAPNPWDGVPNDGAADAAAGVPNAGTVEAAPNASAADDAAGVPNAGTDEAAPNAGAADDAVEAPNAGAADDAAEAPNAGAADDVAGVPNAGTDEAAPNTGAADDAAGAPNAGAAEDAVPMDRPPNDLVAGAAKEPAGVAEKAGAACVVLIFCRSCGAARHGHQHTHNGRTRPSGLVFKRTLARSSSSSSLSSGSAVSAAASRALLAGAPAALVLAAGVDPMPNVDAPAAGALGFAAPASAKAGALPDVLAEKDAPKLGTVDVAVGAAPPNPNPADDAEDNAPPPCAALAHAGVSTGLMPCVSHGFGAAAAGAALPPCAALAHAGVSTGLMPCVSHGFGLPCPASSIAVARSDSGRAGGARFGRRGEREDGYIRRCRCGRRRRREPRARSGRRSSAGCAKAE